MGDHVDVCYDYNKARSAIGAKVEKVPDMQDAFYYAVPEGIGPDGEPEYRNVLCNGVIRLVANKDGFACLAGLTANFLLVSDPAELAYSITDESGLLPGSPTLVFRFDERLDEPPG